MFLLRSEEHTSELQSHSDLVCRLLLEKKKAQIPPPPSQLSLMTTATVRSSRTSMIMERPLNYVKNGRLFPMKYKLHLDSDEFNLRRYMKPYLYQDRS